MSTLELLDAAWLAVRRNWVTLYAASGVGTAPLALATIWYFLWLGRLVKGTENDVFYQGTVIWAAGMAVAWALNSFARTAASQIVLGDVRSAPLSLGDAWRAAARSGPSAAFVGLFSFAAAGLGGLVVVPAVLMACSWWVARPALLTENRPFLGSIRRSARLTEGYRGKAFGVWVLLLLVWLVVFFNLHLVAHALLGNAAGLLGVDTTGLQPYLKLQNQAYVTFLLAVAFVLLDPLKTAADALLYLDLRVRREGADLHERLGALRGGAAALLLLLWASPASALTLDEYRASIRGLRERVAAAKTPADVRPADVGAVRSRVVRLEGGQKLTVDNAWISDGVRSWDTPAEKEALVARLEALERSLGSQPPAASVEPKEALKEILAEPEFQPLAERTELRDLARSINVKNSQNWWNSFWDWLRKTLFKPPAPRPRAAPPQAKAPDWGWMAGWLDVLKWIAIGLGVILLLIILAMLVRWFLERGPAGQRAAATPGTAPPLEASATENALDHSVDEWELFARQWLGKGEVRQAIRALYLATLVHLHRERRIDYNRAYTNWTYVRQFRGEVDHQSVLRRLTQVFDEIWYGERECAETHYRTFEQGVRALGTPAPAAEPAGG